MVLLLRVAATLYTTSSPSLIIGKLKFLIMVLLTDTIDLATIVLLPLIRTSHETAELSINYLFILSASLGVSGSSRATHHAFSQLYLLLQVLHKNEEPLKYPNPPTLLTYNNHHIQQNPTKSNKIHIPLMIPMATTTDH